MLALSQRCSKWIHWQISMEDAEQIFRQHQDLHGNQQSKFKREAIQMVLREQNLFQIDAAANLSMKIFGVVPGSFQNAPEELLTFSNENKHLDIDTPQHPWWPM